jgi:hypothetical protein
VTYLHVVFYLFIFLVGFRFSVPTGAAGWYLSSILEKLQFLIYFFCPILIFSC